MIEGKVWYWINVGNNDETRVGIGEYKQISSQMSFGAFESFDELVEFYKQNIRCDLCEDIFDYDKDYANRWLGKIERLSEDEMNIIKDIHKQFRDLI